MEGRFVQKQSLVQQFSAHRQVVDEIIEILLQSGGVHGGKLPIEFFFYTNTQFKAQHLLCALQACFYEGEYVRQGKLWLVCGWTLPLPIDEQSLLAWIQFMLELGYQSDALFDGWGTLPPVYNTIGLHKKI